MPQQPGRLRRFSDIYIPLRKLSINSADPAQSGILRSLRNFGAASRIALYPDQSNACLSYSASCPSFPCPCCMRWARRSAGWSTWLRPPTAGACAPISSRPATASTCAAPSPKSGKAIVELPFVWCAPPERVSPPRHRSKTGTWSQRHARRRARHRVPDAAPGLLRNDRPAGRAAHGADRDVPPAAQERAQAAGRRRARAPQPAPGAGQPVRRAHAGQER